MKIKKLKLKPCLEKNMKGDGGDCPIWWGGDPAFIFWLNLLIFLCSNFLKSNQIEL